MLKSSAMLQLSEDLDTEHFWPENSSMKEKKVKHRCGHFQNLCELGTHITVKSRFLNAQYL